MAKSDEYLESQLTTVVWLAKLDEYPESQLTTGVRLAKSDELVYREKRKSLDEKKAYYEGTAFTN